MSRITAFTMSWAVSLLGSGAAAVGCVIRMPLSSLTCVVGGSGSIFLFGVHALPWAECGRVGDRAGRLLRRRQSSRSKRLLRTSVWRASCCLIPEAPIAPMARAAPAA